MLKWKWAPFRQAALDMPAQFVSERLLRIVSVRWLARFSLAIAVFFTPFRYRWTLFEQPLPPVYADYTNGLLFLGDLFLSLTLALWLFSLALKPRRVWLGPLFLSLPLGGLLLTGALSALFSVQPQLSFYHLVRMALYTGLYLYIVNEIEDLRPLIWALAGSVFVQAAVGVAQWLAQADLGLQRLGEYELDPAWGGVSIVWAEGVRSLRAYGLSDHPNLLGGLLTFSLLILLSWYAAGAEQREGSVIRTVVGGVFVLGLAALLLTFSRSAWLGFIAGLALSAILLARRRRKLALQGGAALLLAGVIVLTPLIWRNLPYLGVRIGTNNAFQEAPYEKSSLLERAALNQVANQIFADHALTGVGLGAFPAALRMARPEFSFYYQPPHLALLNAAAETGIFGAMFYFLALTTPWLAIWIWRRRLNFNLYFVGACSVLLTISVVGLFDYYPWLLAPGRFWQWMAWGLWAAFFGRESRGV
ncbi:MAG: O-antigen ligase family protein [Anaerolineales bacterium]|nr:O-antigen ligase family protein [Anaerolineales bacterium]